MGINSGLMGYLGTFATEAQSHREIGFLYRLPSPEGRGAMYNFSHFLYKPAPLHFFCLRPNTVGLK